MSVRTGRAHHARYLAYATGKGVARDVTRAMAHLEEAARLGDAQAQCDLAGETYGRDHARALKLFLRSARGGCAEGALGAGRMLFHGRHAERDEARGLELLRAAAGGGAAGAVDELAYAEARVAAAGRSDADNLARAIREVGLADREARIVALARPSQRLVTAPASRLARGTTKIGGAPDVPRGFAWPRRAGRPLAFLAQVRDRAGLLAFFYDAEQQPWGAPDERDAWRVFHFGPRVKLARAGAPKGARAFATCRVSTFDELTIPVARTALARDVAPTAEDYARYVQLEHKMARDYRRHPTADGMVHRVGGYPDAIQGDLGRRVTYALAGADLNAPDDQLERQARRWRLLLQLDSDDRAGMMWGDLGRLYFMVRDDDLERRRFDRVFLQLQCT